MSTQPLTIGFLDGLRPEPLLSVSEWADLHRYLSTEASAEPGRWRTSRTPYLREIMDQFSSTCPTEEIVVMKGAQLGFTEMGFNLVGYWMDISPGPILYVLPTKDVCEVNSKTRLSPMLESSPRLRDKVAPAKSRSANNTLMQKDFAGGTMVLRGANSPAGLRNMPMRFLILDEVDGYPLDAGGEGSPILLAIKRTATFSRRKIYKLSTPTIEGASVIDSEFKTTDQRHYFVPCPHCGTSQKLDFQQLRWDRGRPETAKYECSHCNELIEERFKTPMLAAGEWVATKPDNESHKRIGYHLNSLYSPYGWYSWEQCAKEYEDAEGDDNKMKVFVNTVLGETFKIKGDAPPWENIYNRRESYAPKSAHSDVCLVTCGVDVQGDRLELEIVGWCKSKESYSIDYRVLAGDTSKAEVWEKLRAVLNEKFPHGEGGEIGISLMAVDSGYNTSYVYDFCKESGISRVIPIKGKDDLAGVLVSQPKPVFIDKKIIGGLNLYMVNTGLIKSEVYGNLKLEIGEEGVPAGYCHFPQYDRHYFKMLTAEELRVVQNKKGFSVYEWHKIAQRNEALDCRVYARAASAVLGIDRFSDADWERMKAMRNGALQVRKERKKSSYWD